MDIYGQALSSDIIFCIDKHISVHTIHFFGVRHSWDCVGGMEGPRIESRWVAIYSVLVQTGPIPKQRPQH